MIDDLAEAVVDVVGSAVQATAEAVGDVISWVAGPYGDGLVNDGSLGSGKNKRDEEEQPDE